jgi:hypothetical protein
MFSARPFKNKATYTDSLCALARDAEAGDRHPAEEIILSLRRVLRETFADKATERSAAYVSCKRATGIVQQNVTK